MHVCECVCASPCSLRVWPPPGESAVFPLLLILKAFQNLPPPTGGEPPPRSPLRGARPCRGCGACSRAGKVRQPSCLKASCTARFFLGTQFWKVPKGLSQVSQASPAVLGKRKRRWLPWARSREDGRAEQCLGRGARRRRGARALAVTPSQGRAEVRVEAVWAPPRGPSPHLVISCTRII